MMRFSVKTALGLAFIGSFSALPVAAQQYLDCSLFRVELSRASGPTGNVTFVHASQDDFPRVVNWVSATGDVVNMGMVMPGQSLTVTAAAGSVFEVSDPPGNCVEMFRMTPGQTRYDMRVVPTGEGGD